LSALAGGRHAVGRLRHHGHRGGVIRTHRALSRITLQRFDIAAAIVLALGVAIAWLWALPAVCRFWTRMLALGIPLLGINAQLDVVSWRPAAFYGFEMPFLRLEAGPMTSQMFWLSFALTVLVFVLTWLLPDRMLPIAYLVRAILLIHSSALFFFAFFAARFPHDATSYTSGLMTTGAALISLVPLIFGFTYYIFDFGFVRKLALTGIAIAHLTVFLPIQVLLHARIIQASVLFMPVLYIIFGLALEIMVLISFYAWAMSWKMKPH
jgi:hypothetical protein